MSYGIRFPTSTTYVTKETIKTEPNLYEKAQKVMDDLEKLLTEKNKDENVKNFLNHALYLWRLFTYDESLQHQAKEGMKDTYEALKATGVAEWTPEVKQKGLELLNSIKGFLWQLFVSKDFRNVLMDLFENIGGITEGEIKKEGLGEMEGAVQSEEQQMEAKRNFKRVVRKILENPEWKSAVQQLFILANFLFKKVSFTSQKLKEGALTSQEMLIQKLADNEHFKGLLSEGWTLLEKLFGSKYINDVSDKFHSLAYGIQNDYESQKLIEKAKEWANYGFENINELDKEDFWNQWYDLKISAQAFFKTYVTPLFDSIKEAFNHFGEDPTTKKLIGDLQSFFSFFVYTDATGTPKLKMDNIMQLKDQLVLYFQEQLKNIKLPRYEAEYEGTFGTKYKYYLDNITLNVFDMLPEHSYINTINDVEYDFKTMKTYLSSTTTKFNIGGMNAYLRDLVFAYHKAGSTDIDTGILDVDIRGIELEIKCYINSLQNPPVFDIQKVDCSIKHVDTDIKDTSLSSWRTYISSLFTGDVKRKIESQVEDKVRELFDKINDYLNTFGKFANKEDMWNMVQNFIALPPTQGFKTGEKPKVVVNPVF